MKPIVLCSFVKQRARHLQREKSLGWHQALDEAAREFDHTNYKNYKNSLDDHHQQFMSNKKLFLKNISSETDISKKIDLAAAFIKDNLIPFTDLVWILKPFQNSDVLQSVCEQANLKDDVRASMLLDFLSEAGRSHIMALHQNYKAKELSLGSMTYEMDEKRICINGLYELTVECGSEAYNPKAIDRSLFGTFEMIIHDKDIGMEYTCDHSFDGMCHAGSKNYFSALKDNEILKKKSTDVSYDRIKHCLSNNEPLTGATLDLALDLVDVHGDSEFSVFTRNIGTKLKSGQPLDEYEHHILVDVLMLYASFDS